MQIYKNIPLMLALIMMGCEQKLPADAASENAGQVTGNTAGIPTPATPVAIADAELNAIVKQVMTEQYGSYDVKQACWDYVAKANDADQHYCMKPSMPKLIESKNGRAIYFYTFNRTDINDNPAYQYGAVHSGLMGAYKLSVDAAGDWKYASLNKDMDFGSMGYCGCSDAKFVKLGAADYYGWMFTSGGTWQGITVANHEIVAPQGDTFKNISRVPRIREDEQDISYEIKLVDSDNTKKIFPLLVSKQKNAAQVEELLVNFDENEWVYSLPKNF